MRIWVPLALWGCGGAGSSKLALAVNGTPDPSDDFVPLGTRGRDRPFTTLVLTGDTGSITLSTTGGVSFDPDHVDLVSGVSQTVRIYGDTPSTAENDTTIEAKSDGQVLATTHVTVVTGVKISFSGTFGFTTENNNGYRASSEGKPFSSCGGDADPLIWRATPLSCEQLGTWNQVVVEEGASTRWPVAKRSKIEVLVTGVKTFGPEIDLAGRDATLAIGTPIAGMTGGTIARLAATDCDGDPNTGNPFGQEDGIEYVLNLGYRIGTAMSLSYRDGSSSTAAHIWTAFPPPPTEAEIAADRSDVENQLLPDGETGCTADGMTYFDDSGTFRCQQRLTLRQQLLRHVGFRAMVRRAWANFTTRRLQTAALSDSFIARLFAQLSPAGTAETFLQLGGYDWFTLTGRVDKGIAATPGGIAPKFTEWTGAQGCPTPRQPDVSATDDPYSTAP